MSDKFELIVSVNKNDIVIEQTVMVSIYANTDTLREIAQAWLSTIGDKVSDLIHRIPGFDIIEQFLLKYGVTFPSS